MIPRATLVAVLFVIEAAIVSEMVMAVRGGPPQWSMPQIEAAVPPAAPQAVLESRTALTEGGSPRSFSAGSHPALQVDIGYADLTVVTGDPSRIQVSVSKSDDFGPMRATEPITAQSTAGTVHIGTIESTGWSMGDDRMVTAVVPPQTRVTVMRAGDITLTGLRAEASISSTGNGTVTVDDYQADALHVDANRRISLNGITAGHLDISSDGRIEATGLNARNGFVKSDDGRVTLMFAPNADTLVNAVTSDGSVHVSGFAPGAISNVHAGGGDDDDSDLSSTTVRLGSGDGRLDIHADDGNIDLSQPS